MTLFSSKGPSTNRAVGPGPQPAIFPVLDTHAQVKIQEDAKSRGYTQGHSAGYTAGLRRAAEDAAIERDRMDAEHRAALAALAARSDAEVAALRSASDALVRRTVPVLMDSEHTLLSHALELAEALLGQEMNDGETSARAALSRVAARQDGEVPHTVRMHPSDVAILTGLVPAPADAAGLTIVADASLARGDAVADFPNGFLDARLGTALTRARAALFGDSLPEATGRDLNS
jgi:flagellar assembly protein FliH